MRLLEPHSDMQKPLRGLQSPPSPPRWLRVGHQPPVLHSPLPPAQSRAGPSGNPPAPSSHACLGPSHVPCPGALFSQRAARPLRPPLPDACLPDGCACPPLLTPRGLPPSLVAAWHYLSFLACACPILMICPRQQELCLTHLRAPAPRESSEDLVE